MSRPAEERFYKLKLPGGAECWSQKRRPIPTQMDMCSRAPEPPFSVH